MAGRYMRPNTPHAVFTAESSICHGGFFYAASTIQATIHGIYHCFTNGAVVTNQDNYEGSRLILRQIMAAWLEQLPTQDDCPNAHLPNLTTFEGVINMMMLIVFFELANATYKPIYTDLGNIGIAERMELIEGRRLGRQLFSWFQGSHTIFDISEGKKEPINIQSSLMFPFMASQAGAIRETIKRNEGRGENGDGITVESFDKMVNSSVKLHSPFLALYKASESTSFGWPGHINYVVEFTKAINGK